MKQNRSYGSKALVTNGSVVAGTRCSTRPPVTLGRPLRTFLQNIPTVARPASYSYLAQVSRTDNAAAVPAGGLTPVTAMGLAKVPGKLSVIATLSEPIDKFILEDDTALGGWVSMELTQSVAVALEAQLLSGDGTGDNLTGLANTSGIQLFVSTAGNTDKLVDRAAAKGSKWTEAEPVKRGRWTYPTWTNGKTTQISEKHDGSGTWTAL